MSAVKSSQAKAFAAFFAPKRKAATTDDAAATATPTTTATPLEPAAPQSKLARTAAHMDAHTVTAAAAESSAATASAAEASTASGASSSSAAAAAVTPTKKKATASQRKLKRNAEQPPEEEEEGAERKEADAMDVSTDESEAEAAASPAPSSAAAAAASPSPPTAAAAAAAPKATASASSSQSKAAASKPQSGKKKGGRRIVLDDEDDEGEAEGAEAAAPAQRPAADAAADGDDDSDVEEALMHGDDEIDASEPGSASTGGAFDPVKSAAWKLGEDVPYASLAQLFERIEGEGSRLLTIGWLSDFLRSVIALRPDQLLPVVYLCCNQIAPAYEGKETMVGDFILLKAIAETTGGTVAKLKVKLTELGDLGEVAMSSRGAQKTMFKAAKLTCTKVFQTFRAMADISGKDSGQKKADMIKKMLVACEGNEARYIIRALQGNLRIGMAEKSVIAALARAVTLTPPSLDRSCPPTVLDVRRVLRDPAKLQTKLAANLHLINQAYTEVPNHSIVIDCILTHGVELLPEKCFLKPGVPVKVMLGKPTTGVDALLEKFKDMIFTLEYKYDGERAQVHLLRDGRIMIYSRNSEDHTPKYPDVALNLPRAFNTALGQTEVDFGAPAATDAAADADATPAAAVAAADTAAAADGEKQEEASTAVIPASASSSSPVVVSAAPVVGPPPSSLSSPLISEFIIDCEVVAWDTKQKKILPFQTLSTRKKKDVNQADITVQVCLFAFDLLFINGVSYINEPLKKRREVLRQHFHTVDGQFYFATYKDTADPDEITSFMQSAVRDSCEGLMIKSLEVDATYVPNKRNWVKMKKDYMDGVADSLDLVVIGGWKGLGKRTGVYGAYLLATYDPDTEEFQSICKLGTGFSDEMLEQSAKYFCEHELPPGQIPRDYVYPKDSKKDIPEVWFRPTRIWEVRCADLSISPVHKAAIGKVDENKGIALRFPRFMRERDDKSVPEGITNADQVVEFFQAQSVHGGAAAGAPKRGGR